MNEIGQIQIIQDIRSIWKSESADFTPWLCKNLQALGICIGKELCDGESEKNTTTFRVDITAKDENGDTVIIENQYGRSDHDHLGKLITYTSSFENVKTAIWIVEQTCTEHVNAINMLNENIESVDFYLLKVQAIRVDDSKPAALFTKIAGPDEFTKQKKTQNKEESETSKKRIAFWEKLMEESKKQGYSSFADHEATKNVFMTSGSGISGIHYMCWAYNKSVNIELEFSKATKEENQKYFEKVKAHQTEIDSAFGEPLDWDDNLGVKKCSIHKKYEGGGILSEGKQLEDTLVWCIDKLRKLENATRKYIQ